MITYQTPSVAARADMSRSSTIHGTRAWPGRHPHGMTDQAFHALRDACRPTGGVARGDDLGRLLEDHHGGDYVVLARLIASDEVFGFEWRATLWIPMFQFDLFDLSVRPMVRRVIAELDPVLDRWALAAWFAEANSWLEDRPPMDLLATDLDAVLDAARVVRFIAKG